MAETRPYGRLDRSFGSWFKPILALLVGGLFIYLMIRILDSRDSSLEQGNGKLKTARVFGNSMAPTWFGKHYQLICQECGYVNRFADESFPAPRIFCGNCAQAIATQQVQQRPGDDVEYREVGTLKRWDVVLVREPDEPLRVIKRVIGLPGEKIKIFQGDVWINEERIERSLEDLWQTKVLVHDDSSKTFESRWPSLEIEGDERKWIYYRHQEPWRPSGSQAETAVEDASRAGKVDPLTDWMSADPAYSGPLWPTSDTILELEFQIAGEGTLELFRPASTGQASPDDRDGDLESGLLQRSRLWELRWRSDSLELGGKSLKIRKAKNVEQRQEMVRLRWIVACCDNRLWSRLFVEDAQGRRSGELREEVAASEAVLENVDSKSTPTALWSNTLWLIAHRGELQWEQKRLYRDIYFRSAARESARQEPLERELKGYFLMGDNQPISLDSREKKGWELGVPRRWIEGVIEAR
jgi:signal peptidase I